MVTVLVTGVSGLGRSDLFDCDLVKKRALVYDLGKEMGKVAQERGLKYSESNILRAPLGTLAALRAAAVERILTDDQPHDNSAIRVISAHALFLLRDSLSEGLCTADVEAIRPNLMVTLIDGPQGIHTRLKEHAGEYFHMTLESVVRWQEFEVFFSNHLARDQHVPHYVVPVNDPTTFLALVQGKSKPIVYASYPMTSLPPEQKPRVQQFVERLKVTCTVFDPSSIESSHAHKPHYTKSDLRAIHNHTIVRDLDWFIGINAEAVVAYWPSIVFSSGMNDELRYAYEHGQETYLVAEVLEASSVPNLSPFTTYKSKVFWSSTDFFEYLDLPKDLQRAFMAIQDEMLDVLRVIRERKASITSQGFWEQCEITLQNTMQDGWMDEHKDGVRTLAERIYERWSPLIVQVLDGATVSSENGPTSPQQECI